MSKKIYIGFALVFTFAVLQDARPANAVYLCNPDNVSDPDISIEACTKEIAAGRNLAIAYYDRGLAWARKNETDKALADYNKSLKLNPDYQNAYISRGNALKLKGQAESAIADYDRAIKIDPAKAGLAYYNRGNSWRDKEQNEKAMSDYNKAIELMPRYVNAYVARGNIWKTITEFDKALEDYDAAIRINSDAAGLAYYNRGVTWRKKSEPDKALADYTKYISMVPKDADGYVARGNIYSDKKDYTSAISDYDKALAIDPANALAKSNRENAVTRQNEANASPSQARPDSNNPAAPATRSTNDNACAMLAAYAQMGAPDSELKQFVADCGRNPDGKICKTALDLTQAAKKSDLGLVCTGAR